MANIKPKSAEENKLDWMDYSKEGDPIISNAEKTTNNTQWLKETMADQDVSKIEEQVKTNKTDIVDLKNNKQDKGDYALNSAINNLQKQLDSLFIIGEYKWVKSGTPLKTGWTKVSTTNGFTLVNGINGTTTGITKKHNHDLEKGMVGRAITSGYSKGMLVFADYERIMETRDLYISYSGGENNLAAGIGADLWIYAGTKIVKTESRNNEIISEIVTDEKQAAIFNEYFEKLNKHHEELIAQEEAKFEKENK